jgi:prephenate dehydrogenase
LVVVCTPVDRIAADVRALAAHARPGTLLTDAGSSKREICSELASGLPEGVIYIGSHPLAGSEKQGFEHAVGGLFHHRVCVITPGDTTPRPEYERLRRFWEYLGSTTIEMSADEHDRALAQTSHVPHLAAAAVALTLADANRQFVAGGFRDTTRIAAGDPELWAAILLSNANDVTAGIRVLEENSPKFAPRSNAVTQQP